MQKGKGDRSAKYGGPEFSLGTWPATDPTPALSPSTGITPIGNDKGIEKRNKDNIINKRKREVQKFFGAGKTNMNSCAANQISLAVTGDASIFQISEMVRLRKKQEQQRTAEYTNSKGDVTLGKWINEEKDKKWNYSD